MNNQLSVLLIGGYGVVGKQVAALLNQYYPDVHIIISGRNIHTATAFASTLSKASAIQFNINAPQLPDNIRPQLIVTLANDPDNRVLHFAIKNQIAYLDITRWTDKLKTAITYTHTFDQLHAPIVFSSTWMAGVAASLILRHTLKFKQINSIDINILYSMQDNAGINSVDYMDRMLIPFEVITEGHTQSCMPFSDSRLVSFTDKKRFRVYRFDTPDQLTLPMLTQTRSVSTRIGFNSNITNRLFYVLIHSGFWRLISTQRFKTFRQKLLYNPGKGDEHRILINITGTDSTNRPIQSILSITDPKGQSHLTAIGAFNQIHSIFTQQLSNRVYFGETLPDMNIANNILKKEGVKIDFD